MHGGATVYDAQKTGKAMHTPSYYHPQSMWGGDNENCKQCLKLAIKELTQLICYYSVQMIMLMMEGKESLWQAKTVHIIPIMTTIRQVWQEEQVIHSRESVIAESYCEACSDQHISEVLVKLNLLPIGKVSAIFSTNSTFISSKTIVPILIFIMSSDSFCILSAISFLQS